MPSFEGLGGRGSCGPEERVMIVESIQPTRRPKPSLFTRDPTRRAHFIYSAHLGTAAQQFEAFQKWVVNNGIETLEPSSLVLGCLLSFDGVVSETDIRKSYESCVDAGCWGNAVRIEWRDDARCDARNLSAFTAIACQRVNHWRTFEVAQSRLINQVVQARDCAGFNSEPLSSWDGLIECSAAWLQSTLPPILFGHVIDAARLTALNTSTLAREQRKLALSVEGVGSGGDEKEARANSRAYARAFESALLGRPPSAFTGGQFIFKLTRSLRAPTVGSNSAKRTQILGALHQLAAEIDAVDEVCALIYLYALDLAENGTRRKAKLAPTTPYDYIQSFAVDFHAEFNGVLISNIDTATYSKIYEKLLLTSISSTGSRAAGLKGFHQFLRAWWTVPSLPSELFQIELNSQVEANMVWPHERELLRNWLNHVEQSRFVQQLHTALAIAGNSMIRIGELRVLRLMNVIDEDDHLCIEIAREIRDGKEKSSEGRRRVFITEPKATATIRTWLARRALEHTNQSDYLFGDPSNPKQLADAGKMYFWMNRLLKCVTGDDTINVHSLRHSLASERFLVISLDLQEYEVNPLDELANDAGHVGGHVTATNYCHLFEAGLRRSLDEGLVKIFVGYAAASTWSNHSEATLRQRVSRAKSKGLPRARVLKSVIESVADQIPWPILGHNILLIAPDNPLTSLQPKAISYLQVAGVLTDIASGLSFAQTSCRHDLDESVVNKAIKLAGAFAERHGTAQEELPDELTLGVKALRDKSGALLGLRPDFQRMTQSRWAQFPAAFERTDPQLVADATDYWQRALCKEHIAVRPGPGWDQFVQLLKEAGVNSSLMALKFCINKDSPAVVANALALAQATVRIHLGSSLLQTPQSPRAGRPSCWLVIGSDAKHLSQDGSGGSMAGLNCALLTAFIWHRLRKKPILGNI